MNALNEWEHAIDTIPDAIILIGRDGKILKMNQSSLNILGFEKNRIGESFQSLAKFSFPFLKISLDSVFEEPKVLVEETYSAGLKRYFKVTFSPVMQDGEISRVLCIVRDITDEKNVLEKLVYTAGLISLGELAGGIAHEINNPLAAVVGMCEVLLSRNNIPRDAKEELEVILRSGIRASKIVKRISAFSRSQQSFSRDVFEITSSIEEIISLVSYQFKKRGVPVHFESEESLWILGEKGKFQNAILNIVHNAYDAVRSSKKPGYIKIKTEMVERSGDMFALIDVKDTGPGIPKEIREKIFMPFFTTKTPGEGTGMGLSIAHRIINDIGGEITFTTEKGEGTTFHILCPLHTKSGEKIQKEDKGRVLLISEDADVQSFIRDIFEKLGYQVSLFSKPGTAIKTLSETPYKLVIVDMNLSTLSGYEVFSEIVRSQPSPLKRENFVFITAHVDEELESFVQQNRVKYILKPLSLSDILSVLA